jgi:hypothetical protein
MDYSGVPYYTVYFVERKAERERTWTAIGVKLHKRDADKDVENCRRTRLDAEFRVRRGTAFTK